MSSELVFAKQLCDRKLAQCGFTLHHYHRDTLAPLTESARQEKIAKLNRQIGFVPGPIRKKVSELSAKMWQEKYQPLLDFNVVDENEDEPVSEDDGLTDAERAEMTAQARLRKAELEQRETKMFGPIEDAIPARSQSFAEQSFAEKLADIRADIERLTPKTKPLSLDDLTDAQLDELTKPGS